MNWNLRHRGAAPTLVRVCHAREGSYLSGSIGMTAAMNNADGHQDGVMISLDLQLTDPVNTQKLSDTKNLLQGYCQGEQREL